MDQYYDEIYNSIPESALIEALSELDNLSVSGETFPHKTPTSKILPNFPHEVLCRIIDFCDTSTCAALTQTNAFFLLELVYMRHSAMYAGVYDLRSFLKKRFRPTYITARVEENFIEINGTKNSLGKLFGSSDFNALFPKNKKGRIVISLDTSLRNVSSAINILRILSALHQNYPIKKSKDVYLYLVRNQYGVLPIGKIETELQDEVVRRVCFERCLKCYCHKGFEHTNFVPNLCEACRYGCCSNAYFNKFYVSCTVHKNTHIQIYTTS